MLVCGDFNTILSSEEKKGGRPFTMHEARDFQGFMEEMGLLDIGFSGLKFTWCNKRFGGGTYLEMS